MRRRALIRSAGVAVAGLALAACGGGGSRPTSPSRSGPTVLAVARSNGMGRFAAAAERADMADLLAAPGPYTLFAPTDRAFAGAPRDPEALRRLVAYHVVPGQITLDFMEGINVNHTTLLGSSVNVDGSRGGVRVNGVPVSRAEMFASNGVVFAIDGVLTPR